MPSALPENIVFILSTGRTGTKAFAEGLAGGDIVSPHQPPLSRPLTIASNYYLHGWLPRALLRAAVHQTRLRQMRAAQCRHYVQVFSLDHVPAKILFDEFENVKVLHVVRDPRTFVTSYMNWIHTRFKSYVANNFVPGWHPNGFFAGDVNWKTWRSMDQFQRVCWQWKYKNLWLEWAFGDSPRYRRVRFEDIIMGDDRDGLLRSVLDFMGIPFEERFRVIYEREKNVSKKTHFPKYREWPEERRAQLRAICADAMRHFGYDPNEEKR